MSKKKTSNAKVKGPGLSPNWRRYTCIDRVVPKEYHPAHHEAFLAAMDHAEQIMGPRRSRATLDPNTIIRARMAVVNAKKWDNGKTLRCRFLDGSATQRSKVEAKAHMWE